MPPTMASSHVNRLELGFVKEAFQEGGNKANQQERVFYFAGTGIIYSPEQTNFSRRILLPCAWMRLERPPSLQGERAGVRGAPGDALWRARRLLEAFEASKQSPP